MISEAEQAKDALLMEAAHVASRIYAARIVAGTDTASAMKQSVDEAITLIRTTASEVQARAGLRVLP